MSQTRRSAPNSRKLASRIAFAIAVIALLAAGLWYWDSRESEAAEGAYRTTPVERGDIRVAVSATGTLLASCRSSA